MAATVYQRPVTQGRLALQALYQFLLNGTRPPSRLRVVPHLVMRSNLDLLLERLPVDLETVPTQSRAGRVCTAIRERRGTRRHRRSRRAGAATDVTAERPTDECCGSDDVHDVADPRARCTNAAGSLNVMRAPGRRRVERRGAPPAAAARTC